MINLRYLLIAGFLATVLTGCDWSDDASTESIGSASPQALETGLQAMESDGRDRSYYVVIPEEDALAPLRAAALDPELKPLIIGFHGSFGSHQSWIREGNSYGLVEEVGNEAIMVFPDALALDEDNINWNFDYDFLYFEDLLAELERRGLEWDRKRVFVVGHSSGAGMANEIACLYGDIVRAAAISSGSLISGGSCIGSVAMIQTQGEIDRLVPINVGAGASNFWTGYNGHERRSSLPGVGEPCIDYSVVEFPNEPYPVQWCQHPGGHAWTDFNAENYWAFFKGLPEVDPTRDAPPGGGNEAGLGNPDTTISFTLNYPPDIAPVTSGAITLYPEDYTDGQFRSPSVFLNVDWNPNEKAPGGQVVPGTTVAYNLVPISFFVFEGEFDTSLTYKLQFSVYVEGGSRPIPTPNLDQKVLVPINFVDTTTPVILPEALDVAPVIPW